MKKIDAEVSDLDVADLLKTEEDVKLFLEEALAENDPVLWQHAIGAGQHHPLILSYPMTARLSSISQAVT